MGVVFYGQSEVALGWVAGRLEHMCAVILGYVAAPQASAAKLRAATPRLPSATPLRRQR